MQIDRIDIEVHRRDCEQRSVHGCKSNSEHSTILASLSAARLKDSNGIRHSVRYRPVVIRDQFEMGFQDTPEGQAGTTIIQYRERGFTE